MLLTLKNNKFIAASTFTEKEIVKAAGFRWDKAGGKWWTDEPARALKLIRFADVAARVALEPYQATLRASRALASDFEVIAPAGLNYYPFQKAGIEFMAKAGSYLQADDMGVGKTIQEVGVVNADTDIKSWLVCCRASLKINWYREIKTWLARGLTVGMVDGKFLPDTDIIICPYSMLWTHREALRERTWDKVTCDEAQAIKERTTQAAQVVYSLKALRRCPLTGTPIPNKVRELYPLLHWVDPLTWANEYKFKYRYCGPVLGEPIQKWDPIKKIKVEKRFTSFDGKSNVEELQVKLRQCMLRRLKADVLPDLPAVTRQLIELPADGCKALIELERKTVGDIGGDFLKGIEALEYSKPAAFNELSRIRHEQGVKMLPLFVEHLQSIFDAGGKKILVFAHHQEVIKGIADAFPGSVQLHGGMSSTWQQASIDRFQRDDDCNLFVGSLLAASEGHTLTASRHIVACEIDWKWSTMEQVAARAVRIGQTASGVLMQFLAMSGSVSARIIQLAIGKGETASSVLDRQDDDAPKPARVTSDQIKPMARAITTAQAFRLESGQGALDL